MSGKSVKKKKDDKQIAEESFEPLIIESKNVATVVLLLSSPEEAILLRTCEAIYKYEIKATGDINKQELVNVGVVEPLLNLVSHPNKLVRRFVSMALGELSENVNAKKILLKANCLPAIRSLLIEDDSVTHEFAALWLCHMSMTYTSKTEILENNCVQPLILHLSSSDPDVQKNCVEALSMLLLDFQLWAAMREFNAFPPLLELLRSEYPAIQELALVCLHRSTHEAMNREALRLAGGLDRLIEFLSNSTYNDLHNPAIQVVSNCLQEKESVKHLYISGGLVKILAFALESKNSNYHHQATKAVVKALKNTEIKLLFHEKEVEKTFITLMSSDDIQSQIVSAQALAIMAEAIFSRETISNLGGIELFVQGIMSDSEEMKDACSLALANVMVAMPKNCNRVAKIGGVTPLINLLGSLRESTQINTINCLINMSKIEPLRVHIQEKGVIPPLCALLKSSNSKVQSLAALALASFVTDVASRNIFISCNFMKTLVELMASNYSEIRNNATWAIAVICADEKMTAEACVYGALDILHELMKSQKRKSHFVELAYERILNNNLSLKFSLTGNLSINNVIRDGFYDPGPILPGNKIFTLLELYEMEIDLRRPIFFVNAKDKEEKEREISFVDLPDSTTSKESLISIVKKSDDTPGREVLLKSESDETVLQATDSSVELGLLIPCDNLLQEYIMDMNRTVESQQTVRKQVIELARYVSLKMGGPVERGKVGEFIFDMEINELKLQMNSNAIPIGMVTKGGHYHRALLFKILADRIGIPCSLHRGVYNRSWNEVLIHGNEEFGEPELYPPMKYVVDLMYQPGELLRAESAEAAAYWSLS